MEAQNVDGEFLTRREAARLAGVSYNGIRGWERSGRLTPVRVMNGGVEEVRLRRRQIEAIMRERLEGVMGDEPNIEALRIEVKLLRDERERLLAELAAERQRNQALLEKILEVTNPDRP